MNQSPLTLSGLASAPSMGLKLFIVCGLAILLTIPALFVEGLVAERTRRAADVATEISSAVGGPQTFLGPTLAIPFHIVPTAPATASVSGVYLVSPTQASAALRTVTTERHRSLFKVPVFQAGLNFDAAFDLKGVPTSAPPGTELDWSRAQIVMGISDTRGALSDPTLSIDGKTTTLLPAEIAETLSLGRTERNQLKLDLLGAPAGAVAHPGASFRVVANARFSGAERVAVLAYGKTTRLSAQGDWKDPGFDGGALPQKRTISSEGFTAEWSVPFLARGVHAEGLLDSFSGLNETTMGISFVEVADGYQIVERSLKYVLLILGVVFLSYFVFEISNGKSVHPAQYILVGIAQTIFYLLLLSLSERFGFNTGFLLSAVPTVALLSANAGWVFSSRREAARALAVFSILYVQIYLLLRLEDNALLVGSIASFLAVGAVMYVTRGQDWYNALLQSHRTRPECMSSPQRTGI